MAKKPDLDNLKQKAATARARAEKVHHSSFATEFREFINRGNVVDLAVGVVIGGAFQKIVSSLVSDIVMPVVGIFIGGVDFTDLVITVPNFDGSTAAHVNVGTFIQNTVDFLIVALVIFLMVRFLNRLNRAAEKSAKKK